MDKRAIADALKVAFYLSLYFIVPFYLGYEIYLHDALLAISFAGWYIALFTIFVYVMVRVAALVDAINSVAVLVDAIPEISGEGSENKNIEKHSESMYA